MTIRLQGVLMTKTKTNRNLLRYVKPSCIALVGSFTPIAALAWFPSCFSLKCKRTKNGNEFAIVQQSVKSCDKPTSAGSVVVAINGTAKHTSAHKQCYFQALTYFHINCRFICNNIGLTDWRQSKHKAGGSSSYLFNSIKSGQTSHPLSNIIYHLIHRELSLVPGVSPIDPNTGKLIPELLTQEHIEILNKHRALMREALKEAKKSNQKNNTLINQEQSAAVE